MDVYIPPGASVAEIILGFVAAVAVVGFFFVVWGGIGDRRHGSRTFRRPDTTSSADEDAERDAATRSTTYWQKERERKQGGK